ERDPYLLGARIFKERFLDTLSDEERAQVKAKIESKGGAPEFDPKSLIPPLTKEELDAFEKFKSINSAIDKPADDEDHRDWRDHAVFSGGVDKAKEFIEQVPFEKLQELKASPEARAKFIRENNFDLLSDHAQKQVLELLDKKLLAQKPEDLKYADGKAINEVLKLDKPLYTAIEAKEGQKVVEGIMQMPLADQQKYRQDSEFRKQIDERVVTVLHGAQQEAALHMLESVA